MNAPLIAVLCGLPVVMLATAYGKKIFREYHLMDNSGSCVLTSQLKCGISSAQLPNPIGRHVYTITAVGGSLRLNHHALNPDGFTWTLPPGYGEQEYFEILEKVTNTLTITIRESFGRLDKVEIVNPNFRDNVEFFYRID
jgi:hypothetical protein